MSAMQFYANSEYPEQTMRTLAWLESCSENLLELLESYRYLQPDGLPFSAENIEKILQLHGLHECLAKHEQEHDYHAKMINRCCYEINRIEKGVEITETEKELF